MDTTEVAKKVVDLIAQEAEAVGQTAKEAWPHIVHFTYAKAVTGLVLCGVWVTVILFCIGYWAWITTRPAEFYDRHNDELMDISMAGTGVLGLISFIVALVLFTENFPIVLEPVGATIMELTRKLL